ncbi:MAG: lysophospholipid acyltransferase family protein [Syntrophales bacterium]|jgi:1-acyl-sn-glycerol-3-phosphate acyltransferase
MGYTIFDISVLRKVLQLLAIFVLRIFGWRRAGEVPDCPKFVTIAAPHTSNWDLPVGLAIILAFKVKIYWLGKERIFRWPFGAFFKWLGGIPVNRSTSADVVAQTVQAFKEQEKMIMVVAPEGTRKRVNHWKTGFYYIAMGANVPLVMGFIDYVRREGGFGPMLMPTGDIEADMEKIRAFYQNITAKMPDKSTPATIGHGTGER